MTTPTYEKQMTGPMTWTGEDDLSKEDFVFPLGVAQVAALREVLARVQSVPRDEIVLANNFAMCHSRSGYIDGYAPDQRRLLLRVWTDLPPEDRRLPMGREFFHMENEGGRLGYDPVWGWEGRIAVNDHNNMSEGLAKLILETQVKPTVD